MRYSRSEVEDQVKNIMVDLFELNSEKVVPEAGLFTDLGLDSLDAIDMVITMQQRFNINVKSEESDLQQIRSVQDVYNFVHKYYGNAAVKKD